MAHAIGFAFYINSSVFSIWKIPFSYASEASASNGARLLLRLSSTPQGESHEM